MSFTFSYNREDYSIPYPAVEITYSVNHEDITHDKLCEEFYYFLRGCGFHFKDNVLGIGVIVKDDPILPDEE